MPLGLSVAWRCLAGAGSDKRGAAHRGVRERERVGAALTTSEGCKGVYGVMALVEPGLKSSVSSDCTSSSSGASSERRDAKRRRPSERNVSKAN